jgi:TonB-dependent starch-binding outer membrane protein SusC
MLASSVRARNATVSLAGRNLGIWTNYDLGSDPELNFSGDADFSRTDYMSVPMIRQFRLSFNVNF